MNYKLSREDSSWLVEVWDKLQVKMSAECARIGANIPYIPNNKLYEDCGEKDIYWWTNGFWLGILWQMYYATNDNAYRSAA